MQTLFGKEIVPEHLKNLHLHHHHHSQNSDREVENKSDSNDKDRKSPARADEMNASQQERSLTSFDSSNTNNNTDVNNSATRHKNIEHLTKEERETKLQKLLEEDLLMMGNSGENNKNRKNQNQDEEDDEDDAPKQFKNYSELYRNKKYTYGDTLLVHDALSRLRMIPLARYWIPPSNNEN